MTYPNHTTPAARKAPTPCPCRPTPLVAAMLLGLALAAQAPQPAHAQAVAPAADAPKPTPAAGRAEQTLPAVTVKSGPTDGATQGSGEVISRTPTSTASGLPLTWKETPQSATVITSQTIADQKLQTLNQVVDMTPGLSAAQGNGEMRWEYTARGGNIENLQYDGVPQYIHFYARDAAAQDDTDLYDRIEVVRGATGLLEGTGNPSASVNLVRKRPLAGTETSFGASASTFGNASLSLDHSRPLASDGSVRGRVVASAAGGDGSRDNLAREYGLLYATLDFDLGATTRLNVGASYQKENIDGYSWGGIWTLQDGSFVPGFDSKTSPSLDWEYSNRQTTGVYADLKHGFGNGWKLSAAVRHSDSGSDMFASYTRYDESDTLVRGGGRYEYSNRTLGWDVHLGGPVTLFGRQHDLVFGANGNRDQTRYDGSSYYSFTIADPMVADSGAEARPGFTPRDSYWDMTTTNQGVYASARWSLAQALKLITGARLHWYDYSDDAPWDSSSYAVNREFVPYVGMTYDISPVWTVYGSYTGIFYAQSEVGINGQIDPVKGTSAELGVKVEPIKGQLTAGMAIFRADRDGLAEVDPDNTGCSPTDPTCYRNAGLIRSQGFELELAGALTNRWNLMASYTYSESKYREGESSGTRYATNTAPLRMAKLSTTYRLPVLGDALTVGGSVRAQSELYVDGAAGDWANNYQPYYMRQGGYAVADLVTRYELSHQTSVQLNVFNLFDKTFYTAIANPGYGNFIGAGRSATVSVKHVF